MQDTISSNINIIKSAVPENVQLVAVSKYYPEEKIMEAYSAGQRVFAESRLQELAKKAITQKY